MLPDLPQPSLNYLADLDRSRTQPKKRLDVLSESQLADYTRRIIEELCKRQRDALNLYVPFQPPAASFHECAERTRLVIGPNRSGKTLSASVEVARIVRGLDPFADEKRIPKQNGVLLAVGKDGDHLADPMWKKLSWPGAFWIIKDPDTKQWRSVRPDPNNPTQLDPYDESERPFFLGGKKKVSKWRPAPPLIPPSAMDGPPVWEHAGLSIPRLVRLTSGWQIRFHTSRGNIRMGIIVNVGWFDEEIDGSRWYPETRARLVDTDGMFFWSATPEGATHQLLALHEAMESGTDGIREFNLSLEDSPFMTRAAKQAFFNNLTPDEREVKYYGKFAILGFKTYPTYNLHTHGVDAFDPPHNWMRVLAIDPGARGGVLFGAVPPPDENKEVWLHIYDELALPNASADELAEKIKLRATGYKWETFIMDGHAGRATPMNFDLRVVDHWRNAFKRAGLVSRLTTHGFQYGSDNVDARIESVKRMLADIPGEGQTRIKFHRGKCPMLDEQMRHRIYKPGMERRDDRTAHDMVDALEYLVAYFDTGLYHHPPEKVPQEDSESRKIRQHFEKYFGHL